MGLQENIRAVSPVPRGELANLLKTMEVYVVPSHQEGLCIAALEAMACGCPVVSTRCGGPEEFVKDDETGFLVGLNAEEMADAINRIISDRNLRQRLSAGARELVVEQYSRERCERVFWKAFESKSAIETGTVN
jgi:glycosyltransferase involved in cell wall biosynthesis